MQGNTITCGDYNIWYHENILNNLILEFFCLELGLGHNIFAVRWTTFCIRNDNVILQFIWKSIFYVRHFMLDKNAVTREK